jgi:S1-C subfamily serine protease
MGETRRFAAIAALAVLTPGLAAAQTPTIGAQEIFDHHASQVVQIEVVEARSGTKASIGSGFGIGAAASVHGITNFHVIADIIQDPERYRAVLLAPDGGRHPVRVLAVDVIRDLALIESSYAFDRGIQIRADPPANGERVYALGNPFDIGLSIVEGTYNGLLGHSIERRIHFTGSLNPGMSGGPALDRSGALVGVNVATSGNQVSFLVPADAVTSLIQRVAEAEPAPRDLRASIGAQLRRYQTRYTEAILATPPQRAVIGHALAPTRPAPFFNCWGDAQHDDEVLYQALLHECSSDDSIFLSRRVSIQPVELRHRHLETRSMTPQRFFAAYSQFFESNHSEKWGTSKDFSAFRCRTRFVKSGEMTFKTVFCARRYLHYEGLYDVVFKAALLGRDSAGLESALVLSAFEFDNARRLARRHLESIGWNE